MKLSTPLLTLGLAASLTACVALVDASAPVMRILGCKVNPVGSTSSSDCEEVTYSFHVALTLIPALVMAILTFWFFPYYYCARYCCNCCGSSQQTEGCCCACGLAQHARYSWFEIARAKFYAILCGAMCAVVIAYGTAGAATGKSGTNGFIDSLAEVPKALLSEIDYIGDQLTVQMYNSSTDSYYSYNLFADTSVGRDLNATIRDVADTISDTVADNTESSKGYLDLAMTIVFVIIIVPACMMGLVTIYGILNVRSWAPMLTSAFIFLFLIVLWITNGTIALLGTVLSDACAEIQGIAAQEQNVVSALITCPTSTLDTARSNFQELEDEQAATACIEMNKTCVIPTDSQSEFLEGAQEGRIFECGPDFLNCTGADFARLLNYSENVMYMNASIYDLPNASDEGYICRDIAAENCTLAQCAESCLKSDDTLSDTGIKAKIAITSFRVASTVARVFADIGARFYVCEALLATIAAPMVGACTDASQGLFDTYMSLGIEIMFLIFTVFVCAWGSKRFIPFSEAGKLQDGTNDARRNDDAERPPPRTGMEGGNNDWNQGQTVKTA